MSLSSLIEDRADIRKGFVLRIVRPRARLGQAPIKAPPLTANFGIVGTAFDYLLRFTLQRLNPHAQTSSWVAEQAVELIGTEEFSYDLDRRQPRSKVKSRRRDAQRYLDEARELHQQYLHTGVVTDDLARAAIRLAYIDLAYRIGEDKIDWRAAKSPSPLDVKDLHAMLSAIDQKIFKSHHTCFLNPTFGPASSLVGGADADLLIDGCLIDIKTTKNLGLEGHNLLQLVGYYLLSKLAGAHSSDGETVTSDVRWLGLYFARYGLLWTTPAHDIVPSGSLEDLAGWFVGAVCTSKQKRLACLRRCQSDLAATLIRSLGPQAKSKTLRSKRSTA